MCKRYETRISWSQGRVSVSGMRIRRRCGMFERSHSGATRLGDSEAVLHLKPRCTGCFKICQQKLPAVRAPYMWFDISTGLTPLCVFMGPVPADLPDDFEQVAVLAR